MPTTLLQGCPKKSAWCPLQAEVWKPCWASYSFLSNLPALLNQPNRRRSNRERKQRGVPLWRGLAKCAFHLETWNERRDRKRAVSMGSRYEKVRPGSCLPGTVTCPLPVNPATRVRPCQPTDWIISQHMCTQGRRRGQTEEPEYGYNFSFMNQGKKMARAER